MSRLDRCDSTASQKTDPPKGQQRFCNASGVSSDGHLMGGGGCLSSDQTKPTPPDKTNHNESEVDAQQNNIIEPYLESILRPLNIIQNVFFCAKYRIKDHVIKPISRLYSAVSVIFYFLIKVYLYSSIFLTQNISGVDDFEYFFLNIYHFVIFSIGGLINVVVNIKQKYNNVLYVLKIQNVHRILKLDERCYNRTIISNWVCVLAINCFHIIWTFIYFFAFDDIDILNIMSGYMCIRFDFNGIYATRCLRLITESLKNWRRDLQMCAYTIDSRDESYWDAMFGCFIDITEVFQLIEKTFEPMYTLLTCSSLTWVIKNLLIITFLCVECEKYYSAIKQVESTCSQMITSERSSVNQRRFCKNILRVQGATFNKLRVCGLFAVDASFPLRVIAFITTYIIVLLQFVFL
uniref:Gustatory receptor n=1 Tax=Spodoptera frugiperda TaxID=7108 RepID=A0A2H1WBG5_SPOFR